MVALFVVPHIISLRLSGNHIGVQGSQGRYFKRNCTNRSHRFVLIAPKQATVYEPAKQPTWLSALLPPSSTHKATTSGPFLSWIITDAMEAILPLR